MKEGEGGGGGARGEGEGLFDHIKHDLIKQKNALPLGNFKELLSRHSLPSAIVS